MWYIKQVVFPFQYPSLSIGALTLWAVPVAAAVVVFLHCTTLVTGLPMTSHIGRFTMLQLREDTALVAIERDGSTRQMLLKNVL